MESSPDRLNNILTMQPCSHLANVTTPSHDSWVSTDTIPSGISEQMIAAAARIHLLTRSDLASTSCFNCFICDWSCAIISSSVVSFFFCSSTSHTDLWCASTSCSHSVSFLCSWSITFSSSPASKHTISSVRKNGKVICWKKTTAVWCRRHSQTVLYITNRTPPNNVYTNHQSCTSKISRAQ